MIKALIFDCFGVLYQGDMEYMLERVSWEYRTQLRDIYSALDFGYITYDDFCRKAAPLLGLTSQELRQLAQHNHIRNDRLFELVTMLKKDYQLALLSNAGRGVIESLLSSDLALFNDVIISSSIGVIKPSRKIFEYTVEQLALRPAECLFIDDITANIEAAAEIGMQGIVYESYEQVSKELTARRILHA